MTDKIKAAIIGSGKIGTDLMIKIIKYRQNMELVAVVGIDPASEGVSFGSTPVGCASGRPMSASGHPDQG